MKIAWDRDYSVSQAKRDYERLRVNDMEVTPIVPDSGWDELRSMLIAARDDVFEQQELDGAEKLGYNFDVAYGFKLYGILSEKNGFRNRDAASDDLWNYLSIRVIPDVVHARWGLKPERYYQNPRRTWLKNIWWYIHLSWNNDEQTTHDIIRNNTTDTILNLVERPGLGYYVDVYREIMKRYSDCNDRDLFRKVLKLNTARLLTTSPELVDGGIEAYVEGLFRTAGGEER